MKGGIKHIDGVLEEADKNTIEDFQSHVNEL